MEQEVILMEVVNPQAAGVDIGSRSHWVEVGQSEQDVREYGVFNQDLFAMADWLKEKGIKTVAMECTGTYWQNLYANLISRGFEVILCNGQFTKNIKGKKTDINDCQWIQKLHTLGLLTGCVLIAVIAQICSILPYQLPRRCKNTSACSISDSMS